MQAIETQGKDAEMSSLLRQAALAGLGSKYLAVGSPATLGIIACGAAAPALQACHELLFGTLQVRSSGDNLFAEDAAVAEHSIEESLACDIVCLPTEADFAVEWIAEATHLNLVDSGPWSMGMQALLHCARFTLIGQPRHTIHKVHGRLTDVITGSVSGRMGEEITALLWTPDGRPGG